MYHLNQEFYQYLPISQLDRDWGLYITGAGYASVPPNSPYPPSTHPSMYHFHWEKGRVLQEFQLLYFPKGQGTFESKNVGTQTIQSGHGLILFPGVWHRYRPLPKIGWDEFWIGFGGNCADQWLEKGFFQPSRPLYELGVDETFLSHFLQVLDLVQNEPLGFQQRMTAEVMQLLTKILARNRAAQSGGDAMELVIRQAKCVMVENLQEALDMKALAQSLNVSYEHFRRCFKHITGLAPHQYHLELKLNRAKELLKGTDLSIKSISIALGFDNPYYFSKWFKKKMGQAPHHWRQH